MLASDSGLPLRPVGLANAASDSDPPLRPEGLASTASDSDPRLRPGMHRTSAYNSSPTGAVEADWDQPTGDTRLVRTQETSGASKIGHSSQTQYRGPYPMHVQDSTDRAC